jgi:hypothetical protein
MQDFRRGGSDDGETRQSCSAIRHLVVNTPVFTSNPITLTENTKGILADDTIIFRKTGIASSMTILTRPLLKYDLLFSFTSVVVSEGECSMSYAIMVSRDTSYLHPSNQALVT